MIKKSKLILKCKSLKIINLFFRYRGRYLDDEDDLRNMESSFDQIEKEEDFRYIYQERKYFTPFDFVYSSRRQGLREDIDDIMREDAEKKRRLTQTKKRPKTAA